MMPRAMSWRYYRRDVLTPFLVIVRVGAYCGLTLPPSSPTTLPSLALTLCPKRNAIHAQSSMSISLHETFRSSKYDHSSRLCPLGAFYQTATPPSPLPSVPGPMATPKNPASFVQRTPIPPSLRYNRRAAYRRETVFCGLTT